MPGRNARAELIALDAPCRGPATSMNAKALAKEIFRQDSGLGNHETLLTQDGSITNLEREV